MSDLFLRYERTDDRNRGVYGIYDEDDRLRLKWRLGEVRLEKSQIRRQRPANTRGGTG